MILTGVVQAWVRVGSWGALFGTPYGLLLIGKSALLAVALGAAMFSRRLVNNRVAAREHAHNDNDNNVVRDEVVHHGALESVGTAPTQRAPAMARLRRTVHIEAAAGAAAIALAAVLVATPPAKDTYAVAKDTVVSFDNSYTAQLSLDPARTGPNTLHLYLFDRSNALAGEVEEVAVTIENQAAQIGPLELDAQNVGQGHFIASGVELPASGVWTVAITFAEPGFGAVTDEGDIDVG